MGAGAAEVGRHAALLDQINVFPVMDADTGANLSGTLSSLVDIRENDKLDAIVRRLLSDACGNSGIILAQFIVGFLEAVHKNPKYSLLDFTSAVTAGKDKAYKAVLNPKEGTMLSSMNDFAAFLYNHPRSFDFSVYEALCDNLLCGVVSTQDRLSVLKAAGVPDSGALGFYFFASGLALAAAALEDNDKALKRISAVKSGAASISIEKIQTVIAPAFIEKARLSPAEKKFCVNLLIESDFVSAPKTLFENLGDSVDLVKEGNLLKLHIHTDDADALTERAAKIGKIIDKKVQDLQAAMTVALSADDTATPKEHIKFRVVTDSAASLDRRAAAQLGILCVDNRINLFGKQTPDREVNLDEVFLGMQNGRFFKTAQVTPEEATIFLKNAFSCSNNVLYIGVGKAYTGTQAGVRNAAQHLHLQGGKWHILDSKAASGQLGLICTAAQRFARTAASFDEVIAYAQRQIETCTEYLVIDDLKYLVKSGRIGRIRAAFAAALSIKPIVGHGNDGAVTIAKARSTDAAVDEILHRVTRHPGDGPFLVMVEYTDNRAFAQTLKERLKKSLPPDSEIILAPLSAASAVHMGPGTFGIAVTRT